MHPRLKTVAIAAVGLTLVTCGGELRREAGDMLKDAGDWLASMDATAQGTAPPARVITADTDLSRLESGLVFPSPPRQLVAGPIIVTDLFYFGGGARFWVAPIGSCTTTSSATFGTPSGMMGARIPVRAGQALCAESNTNVHWAGFRPFD